MTQVLCNNPYIACRISMDEINNSRIKLSQLRALVAVAVHGNFSEAALHLGLSQSAVGRTIATWRIGVLLLSRGRHGAHLTPVGESD